MALSATTFLLIRLFRGQSRILKQNYEVYWFYGFLIASTALLTLLVELTGELPDHDSIRTAAFQATSILTTTGYASTDFDTWLPPAKMLLMILMFIEVAPDRPVVVSRLFAPVVALLSTS